MALVKCFYLSMGERYLGPQEQDTSKNAVPLTRYHL